MTDYAIQARALHEFAEHLARVATKDHGRAEHLTAAAELIRSACDHLRRADDETYVRLYGKAGEQ